MMRGGGEMGISQRLPKQTAPWSEAECVVFFIQTDFSSFDAHIGTKHGFKYVTVIMSEESAWQQECLQIVAALKMRHLVLWSNRSKRLGLSHSSEGASLISEAIRNSIRAGKLPLFECLNECVRSEGVIYDGEVPALKQRERL